MCECLRVKDKMSLRKVYIHVLAIIVSDWSQGVS